VCAAITLGATPAEADTARTKARLAAGEIIVSSKPVRGSEQPRATVIAVVDAAPERVWAIISRCADYKRTMVRVAESAQLWKKGHVHRCRVTVDLPFPLDDLTATTDATHTVIPGKRWERKWTLVEGDYARNSGSWTLAPFEAGLPTGGRVKDGAGRTPGARTLVIYKVHAEPDVPIPDGLRRAIQRKTLPNLIENLRKQVTP